MIHSIHNLTGESDRSFFSLELDVIRTLNYSEKDSFGTMSHSQVYNLF